MPVFRVNKEKDYVTMSNYHLKDKRISLKAKGLLSQMLSLPENWNYTVNGLISINKEEETSIKATLKELQRFRYLIVTKQLPNETSSGRIEYIYDIFEKPKQEGEKQEVDFLGVDFLPIENKGQYNINNKIINNKIINNIFKKPTLEEVQDYCNERNNGVDAQRFIDFYESKGWMVGKNKMKDWKACVRTWEKKNNQELPKWFNRDIKLQEMTKEEQEEMAQLLDNF